MAGQSKHSNPVKTRKSSRNDKAAAYQVALTAGPEAVSPGAPEQNAFTVVPATNQPVGMAGGLGSPLEDTAMPQCLSAAAGISPSASTAEVGSIVNRICTPRPSAMVSAPVTPLELSSSAVTSPMVTSGASMTALPTHFMPSAVGPVVMCPSTPTTTHKDLTFPPWTPSTPSSTTAVTTPLTPSSSSGTMSMPTTPSATDAVTQRMLDFRHDLVQEPQPNEYYLGDPSFDPRAALTWVSCDGTNILTSVEDAERYRHEQEVYSHDPTNVSEPDLPRAADLVAVFRMDAGLYYLTADGNWQEEGPYAKPFDECKATFLGAEPSHDLFAADFERVERNIRTLVEMARTRGHPSLKGLYQKVHDGRSLQKFSHKMFEPLEAGETVPTVPHKEYTIEGWPVRNFNAQKALEKLKETHRVNILAAFDVSGEPIRPSFYAQRMRGCDARIHFTFTHWYIHATKVAPDPSDTFVCDLQQIQVLAPAPPKKAQKGKRSWQRDVFTPFGSPSPKRSRNM